MTFAFSKKQISDWATGSLLSDQSSAWPSTYVARAPCTRIFVVLLIPSVLLPRSRHCIPRVAFITLDR